MFENDSLDSLLQWEVTTLTDNDNMDSLLLADIALHVANGECPPNCNLCEHFDSCIECWWYHSGKDVEVRW